MTTPLWRSWATRLPAMTVRRRIIISFVALVGVAVALVGGISYSATVTTFNHEADQGLVAAATSVAAGVKGGVAGGALGGTAGGAPHGPAGGAQGSSAGVSPVPPRGDHDRPGPGGFSPGQVGVSVLQRIDPAGTVVALPGSSGTITPDADDLARLRGAAPGTAWFGRVRADGVDYRTYTIVGPGDHGAILAARNTDGANRVLAQTALNTLLIGVAVVILAGLVGWWIARQITRRLATLSQVAESVARSGDLDVPIDETGRDEVSVLAQSIRRMLGELAASRRSQQRLIEDAGHELRTPLTSLRTNVTVLRRIAELPDADRATLLDDVDGELRELTDLVNELVELATDSYVAEPQAEVPLGPALEKVAARVRRTSGRAITVTGDDAVVRVQPQGLERAVGNVLENAVKFDTSDAPIEVRAVDGIVTVADHGPGVAPDDLDVIFERFHRTAAARALPGSGLGLAMVREIATRNGGFARAELRAGGTGLVVTVGFAVADGSGPVVEADS